MRLELVKAHAETGDLILVKGEGFFSDVIRMFTGESFSHVALLARFNDDVKIVEFVGSGFAVNDCDEKYFKDDASYYFCKAPHIIHKNIQEVMGIIQAYVSDKDRQSYGYETLPLVWMSQLMDSSFVSDRKVCSTFVQRCWEEAGFKFPNTPDPGDFVEYCEVIFPIEQ